MADDMRAAVLAAPGEWRVERAPKPRPGPGQALVRLEGSGVCGSDLAPFEGRPWFEYPRAPGAPGHEGWGRVEAVGEGVRDLQAGDRVTGLFGHAYADFEAVDARHLLRIPPELGEGPFLGEPLACAMNAFRRSDVRQGQRVAVVGVGFMGALLAGLCAGAGARVVAISRRDASLKFAEQMGARDLIALDDQAAIVAEVERLTDGRLCDRVIEATGLQAPLDLATRLTRTRGRLVIAGYHQDGHRSVDMQAWNWRGLDVINAHERDPMVYMQGMRDAAAAVERGRLDPDPLLTHDVPLDQIGKAFDLMRDRPDGFLKAVVRQ